MPKSRRNKAVPLSKTEKKGKVGKDTLLQEVKSCLSKYSYLYVFLPENMRNNKLQEIRTRFRTSRFFFGKNKVMQHALGKDEESELKPNLHLLSKMIIGQCGLLFTNENKSTISNFFEKYRESEFPRAGFVSTKTVALKEGPLTQFPASMEPTLRGLGLPSILDKGVIQLRGDYTICKEGDTLSPEQAKLLKFFGEKMAEFKIHLLGVWTSKDGKFEKLKEIVRPQASNTTSTTSKRKNNKDGDNNDEEMADADDDDDDE
eukprot:TRINITY_DN8679_c0_g1_i1.p1 TRINITY_DN8679_c0_g1~~TRINITY_DN8679_c0_g1_i1.p1  ORF type:complete len:260 (-),score=58.26 TRINITY_DN8679_c0_g1_i1:155-934(-)